MNSDDKHVWPEDMAKRWAKCTAEMMVAKKRSLKWQRINIFVALGNMVMAALHALGGNYWLVLVSTLLCWWIYRYYLAARQRVAWWHEAQHHASRVLQETEARAEWHLEQIDVVLTLMKEHIVIPNPFSSRKAQDNE